MCFCACRECQMTPQRQTFIPFLQVAPSLQVLFIPCAIEMAVSPPGYFPRGLVIDSAPPKWYR